MPEVINQITLPINLSLATGAYTTKLWIGSEQIEVNVIIDTGSSTLAIDLNINPEALYVVFRMPDEFQIKA